MKIVIAGAGIGGLTTALLLHERGIECEIYEKVPELLQIGVGLALLPHAAGLRGGQGTRSPLRSEARHSFGN